MKKVLGFFIAASTIFFSMFFANAADYEAGKHYVKVQEIAVDSPEVREYFSFYCPHCYKYEPLIAEVKKALPQGVSLQKNHVDFLPGASRKMQQLLTKALIIAQEMDIAESQVDAIFKYIHVHRAVFTSIKDVRNVFILNGADGETFDTLLASDTVRIQAEEMRSNQDILATSGDLKSVPSVIVNGKYLVDTHELDKENFVEDYNNLIKFLLTLD